MAFSTKFLLGLTRRGKKWHIIGISEKRFNNELAVYGSAISYCDSEVIDLVTDESGKPRYFPPHDIFNMCVNCVKSSGIDENEIGELNKTA